MAISDKLTYLNTTKGKIKDSINITGVGITDNDTFRSYSTKLKDGIVDMINNGTETAYNNFPKTTDTGSDITLNDTYNSKLKVDLKGNTHQETYTGKNLLNIDGTRTSEGLTNTTNGTIISVSGTSSNNYTSLTFNITQSIPIGTYTFSIQEKYSKRMGFIAKFSDNSETTYYVTANTLSTTFTTTKEIISYRLYMETASTTQYNMKIKPQLEANNQSTSWEPYTNLTPSPNPDYPQDIEVVTGYNEVEVVGRNLFDSINLTPKYSTSNTSAITIENGKQIKYSGSNSSTGAYLCLFVITKLNDYVGKTVRFKANFTASASNKGRYALGLSNFDGSNRTQQTYTATSGEIINFQVPTLNNEQTYLYISLYANHSGTLAQNNYVNYTNIILTIDDEDMNYEPYQSQSYEINLGKNLFDKNSVTDNSFINSSGGLSTQEGICASDFIPVIPNKTYYVPSRNDWKSVGFYDKSKTFIERSAVQDGAYTITNNAYYIRISLPMTLKDTYQLEQGTQASSYSPYKTPIEMCKIPNTDYKDEIRNSTGKNLLDYTTSVNGTIGSGSTSEELTPSNNTITSAWIPCKPNTSYTISGENNRKRWQTKDNNGNITFVADDSTTITTNSTAKYLRVYYYYLASGVNPQSITNVMLNEGNQATDLEPYGVGVRYKYNKIGKVILDGSEDEGWGYSSSNALFVSDFIREIAEHNNEMVCSHFTIVPMSTSYANMSNGTIRQDNNSSRLIVKYTDYTTATAFKTWLSTHNTEVYYVLSKPTVTILDDELQNQLNELESANSYLGQTNITAEYISGNQPFDMSASALLKEA